MWNKLEKILKRKDITIYKLGKLSGVPQQTIRNLKNGIDMQFSNVVKIADTLDISLDELR